MNYYDDYRFLDLLPAIKTALQYTHEAGYDTWYENAKGLVTGASFGKIENTE